MATTKVLFSISLAVLLVTSVRAQKPNVKNPAPDYLAVVEHLVSPNKEPTTHVNGRPTSIRFPLDYDVPAQHKVNAARGELRKNFVAAIPFMIDALEDERYSLTINWADGDGYYNYSVGSVCRDIIAAELEVYRDAMVFDKRSWREFTYPISKEWWMARSTKSLAELQLEAIDWAVAKRGPGVTDPRFDPKMELAALRKLRAEIVKTGKPLQGRRLLPMVTSSQNLPEQGALTPDPFAPAR